jgi:hypothetical protein
MGLDLPLADAVAVTTCAVSCETATEDCHWPEGEAAVERTWELSRYTSIALPDSAVPSATTVPDWPVLTLTVGVEGAGFMTVT